MTVAPLWAGGGLQNGYSLNVFMPLSTKGDAGGIVLGLSVHSYVPLSHVQRSSSFS